MSKTAIAVAARPARAVPVPRAPGKPRRSQSERREEAEQRMLEAAVKIVAERGLESLTLAECGEAAGYSRGLAAHYFGSHERLLVAIAGHIVRDYARRRRSTAGTTTGLAGLVENVAFYLDSGRDNATATRAFHAVLSFAPKQPALARSIAQLNRSSAAGFAKLIEHGIARGEIRRDVDARAQGTLILATLRGVMAQWLVSPKRMNLEALKSQLLASLRRSLSA